MLRCYEQQFYVDSKSGSDNSHNSNVVRLIKLVKYRTVDIDEQGVVSAMDHLAKIMHTTFVYTLLFYKYCQLVAHWIYIDLLNAYFMSFILPA